jgi:hypothetical protein
MYQVDEKDKVIELKDVPQSSVGAPIPIVLCDEHKLFLAYFLQNTPPNWDFNSVRVITAETEDFVALVEFERYESFMFGNPNDEAFSGHPLAGRGLGPYTVFEIENSSWVRTLERMNSVHPYHNPEKFEKLKHFVFAFHDSTFECVAENFSVSISQGSMKSAAEEIKQKLYSWWDS